MTDALGQSQVLPYVFGLSNHGYKLTVISFEKKKNFTKLRAHIQDLCDQNNVKWLPREYTKTPPVVSTLFDLYKLNKTVKNIVKNENVKLVHCRSYLPVLIALRFKNKFSIPYIFDMRGYWADERVEGNIWNLRNPIFKFIYRFFKKKEKQFLMSADHIISLTQKSKLELLKRQEIKLDDKRISVIPCTSDFDHFALKTSSNSQRTRAELNISEKSLVIGYLGSMGTWYLLDEMLKFIKALFDQDPSAIFVIYTQDDRKQIKDRCMSFNIDISRVRIDFKERGELQSCLDAWDYGLFFIRSSFSKMASSPTKMGELLAKGIPVIGNSGVGDVDDLIDKMDVGYVVDLEDQQSIINTIKKLKKPFRKLPEEIRESASSKLHLNHAISNYLKAYKTILK